MRIDNASGILKDAIVRALCEGNTLHQAFLSQPTGDIPMVINYTSDMNEQTQVADGVGDMAFDHGLSE